MKQIETKIFRIGGIWQLGFLRLSREDINILNELRGFRYCSALGIWHVTHHVNTIGYLNNTYGGQFEFIPDMTDREDAPNISETKRERKMQIVVNHSSGMMMVKHSYDTRLYGKLKALVDAIYDRANRHWVLEYDRHYESVMKLARELGFHLDIKERYAEQGRQWHEPGTPRKPGMQWMPQPPGMSQKSDSTDMSHPPGEPEIPDIKGISSRTGSSAAAGLSEDQEKPEIPNRPGTSNRTGSSAAAGLSENRVKPEISDRAGKSSQSAGTDSFPPPGKPELPDHSDTSSWPGNSDAPGLTGKSEMPEMADRADTAKNSTSSELSNKPISSGYQEKSDTAGIAGTSNTAGSPGTSPTSDRSERTGRPGTPGRSTASNEMGTPETANSTGHSDRLGNPGSTETSGFWKVTGRFYVPLDRYIELLLIKNNSRRTIDSYRAAVKKFMDHFWGWDLQEVGNQEIRDYLYNQYKMHNYSASTLNVQISAIKTFYKLIYNIDLRQVSLPRPKAGKHLPKVIKEADIRKMIERTINLKHRAIICTLYSTAIRRDEILSILLSDIDIEKGEILIRGKGNKERKVYISVALGEILRKYMKDYRPQKYLYEGPHGRYSSSSIANIVKKAAKRAGIHQRVTPHMLRHSYATHMLTKGVGLPHIQQILGHNNIRTTLIYTHLTNQDLRDLPNPLDEMDL